MISVLIMMWNFLSLCLLIQMKYDMWCNNELHKNTMVVIIGNIYAFLWIFLCDNIVKYWLITNSLGMLAYSFLYFKFFQADRMSHLLPPSVFSDMWYYYYASPYGLYQVQFYFILLVHSDTTYTLVEFTLAHRVGPMEQYMHYPHFQSMRSSSFMRGSEHPLLDHQYLR